MTSKDAADTLFTDEIRVTLRALANMMIPASDIYNIPGAGDDKILGDIIASAAPQAAALTGALAALNDAAGQTGFASLADEGKPGAVTAFAAAQPEAIGLITLLVTQCYYRDDRVMRSLQMEARPPHPKGFEVESGDWSLLDPVRKREAFYRKAP